MHSDRKRSIVARVYDPDGMPLFQVFIDCASPLHVGDLQAASNVVASL